MKRLALTSLICGLCIIGVSVAIATAALGHATGQNTTDLATADCLFCRVDPYLDWHVISAPTSNLDVMGQSSPASSTQCGDCHALATPNDLPGEDIEDQIALNQQRLVELRAQIDEIHTAHPEWQQNLRRSQKPDAQITAERVNVIVNVLEADGGWGFHDLTYTNTQLLEAEQLIDTLHTTLGS